ncbi:hypothetical protein Tco_1395730 [Tanacetum coccineum]
MIDWLSIVETDKMIHTVETNILKLVVEIKSFGMSFDEFDKEIRSSDGLQPKQADQNYVHALNELNLHEIRVVTSKHEVDQLAVKISSRSHVISLHEKLNPFPKILSDSMIANKCIDLRWPDEWTILKGFKNHSSMLSIHMYNSILPFQESYISLSSIGGRLSAPKRIALSARVVIEKFVDTGKLRVRLTLENYEPSSGQILEALYIDP